jgi:hypothetical protein
MDQRLRRLLSMSAVALVCLVLVTARVPAQQRDALQAAAAALSVATVSTVHLEGFGATYSVGQSPSPREMWPRVTLQKYEADIDYAASAMRVVLVRDMGAAQPRGGGQPFVGEQRVTQFVNGAHAWDQVAAALPSPPRAQRAALAERTQQIWSTPHGFLKAARLNRATARAVPQGTEVVFISGGRRFVGLINARNEVDRVQTWVNHPAQGEMLVETLYRDYEKSAAGVLFPRHITQSLGSYVALDVWVSSVAVNTPVVMPTPDAIRDDLARAAGQ